MEIIIFGRTYLLHTKGDNCIWEKILISHRASSKGNHYILPRGKDLCLYFKINFFHIKNISLNLTGVCLYENKKIYVFTINLLTLDQY
jgi:hypothetical protein